MDDDPTQNPQVPAPFAPDYPDERTAKALAQDRARVYRQTDALRASAHQDAFQRQILKAIQSRRSDRTDLVAIDVVRSRRRGLIPVVRGEILVRAGLEDEDPGLWGALEPHQFEVTEVDGLDRRLLRLSNPAMEAEELHEIARFIRRHQREASVNHVAPLQPMVKGEGGPEPTMASLDHPPAFVADEQAQQRVRVAVIDTGITDKPRGDGWLAGIPGPANVDPLDAIPMPNGLLDFAAGHGTFAAGIVQQVAPHADVLAYRAIDSDGIGSEVDVASAMVQAASDGAQIISLSLGAETLDDQPLLAIEVALDILAERFPDVLVVAAAGNTGRKRPVFPAASRRVLAVAGLTAAMAPAVWSTRGWWVDCSAVGEGVLSTYVEGVESTELDPAPDTWGKDPWALWSGTSFAAPQISGVVARLCGETPGLTPRTALKQVLGFGRPTPDFGVALRILPGT